MNRLVELIKVKEDEKSEMLDTFEERLKKMREDYKSTCNKIRNGMIKTAEELKSKNTG